MKLLAAIASCLVLSGCATKHVRSGIDAIIPVSCIHHAIRMVGCNQDLTHCQKFLIDHEKNCEQVVAH